MRFVCGREIKRNTELLHASSNRRLSNMQLLSNPTSRVSKRCQVSQPVLWNLSTNLRPMSRMVYRMLSMAHHDQVFRSVIQSIVITVMNYFVRFQRASKQLLHDIAMFLESFPINGKHLIPTLNPSAFPPRTVGANAMLAVPLTHAARTAKYLLMTFRMRGTPIDFLMTP